MSGADNDVGFEGGIINDKSPKSGGRGKNSRKKDRDQAIDGKDFFCDKRNGAMPNKFMNPNHKDVPFYYTRKRIKKKDGQTKLFNKDQEKSEQSSKKQKQNEESSLLDRKGNLFENMDDRAKYIVNDIKTSRVYGYHKKKTREEQEKADDRDELVITPIGGKKN